MLRKKKKIKKNLLCDKTKKFKIWQLKMWQNSKIQNLTKLKNSNCDKTQNVTTQNSTCDRTQKSKILQNSKWDKTNFTKLNNSKCDKNSKSDSDSTYGTSDPWVLGAGSTAEWWNNSKTLIVTKLKTQIMTKVRNSNWNKT